MSTTSTPSTSDADLFGLGDDDETIPPPAVTPPAAVTPVTPTITPTVVESNDSDSQLAVLVKDAKLERDSAALVLTTYNPLVKRVQEWAAKIDTIIPPNREPTVTEHKVIKETRLALVKVRTGADKKRKEILEDTKRFTAAMNDANRRLVDLVAPLEEKLEAAEKFAERQAAERKAKFKADRDAAMLPFGTDTSFYNFGEMSEDSFQQLYAMTKANHEKKLEDARKAEEDRLAKEAADRAEQARVRAENERLRAEAAERDRIAAEERAKAAREKAEADAKLAAERAAAEAALKAEREKAEKARLAVEEAARKERERVAAEAAKKLADEQAKAREAKRIADEKARKDREIAEAALAAERKKAAEAAAEAKRLKDEEAARLAEIEAAKKRAAAAPDKDKLKAFAAAVRALPVPALTTPEAATIATTLKQQVEKFAAWIEKQAEGL